uniref:ATP-dependent RNA helicase n=1 Tax=Callorhinchus milii TaxID=7868 RepID=A0A4W3GRD1_CALMI
MEEGVRKIQNDCCNHIQILFKYPGTMFEKVQRTLPQWLSNPMLVNRDIKQHLTPIEAVPGIHPKLLRKLQGNGIHFFFPVQAEVIPMVLESAKHGLMLGRGGYRPSDICVSAPTGSGKTLAFLIPVLQALMDRAVCRIRALVVLPTKELAQQVCKVFNVYADGTGVRVVLMAGQKSFAVEQTSLVDWNNQAGISYRSLVDIVVATPGRLVDHIARTPGFSLQHLRYLVIDEADTMIDSMHQDWLMQVVKAVYQADANLAAGKLFRRTEPGLCTAQSSTCVQMPLQKLLFSATLTPNPEKLQQLSLYQPQLFTSTYTAPGQCRPQSQEVFINKNISVYPLQEFYVPCQLNKKPLIILYFMLRMRFRRVLCFTNSREASHRLYVLIRAFGGIEVAEFSSRLSPQERRKTLKMFEQGKLQLLISTDATARGIDIKEVMCVINYDAPQFIRTYIHRVGRTARAGKAGLAFTFLLHVQEERFLQMMKDAGSKELKKQLVKHENLTPLIPRYEESLLDLKRALKVISARSHVGLFRFKLLVN